MSSSVNIGPFRGGRTRFGGSGRPTHFGAFSFDHYEPITYAPAHREVELWVSDGSGAPYALPFPCLRKGADWFNARRGSPIAAHLKPIGWRWRSFR